MFQKRSTTSPASIVVERKQFVLEYFKKNLLLMERWKIWAIISLMSFALIGVAMSQIYWIKWSISLDQKNFTSKVFRALNEVRNKIDIEIKNIDIEFNNHNTDTLSSNNDASSDDWRESQILKETKSLEYSLNPDAFLEKLDPEKINQYVDEAFEQQGIDNDFIYGIYSNKKDDFLVIKDRIAVNKPGKSDDKLNLSELKNTKYKVSLLSTEFNSPGSLNLLFTDSNWSNKWPILLLNLIFTILILFVFSYTIYTIFKQKKISQMKTDFVNNMTHEFKTPIATISLATDSILSPVVFNDKEKIKKFINIIKEENSRLLNQVENVLQIAKLDKRKIELTLTEIDIHEVLDETVQHLKLKLDSKNAKIIKDYQASDPFINADETHILNIFSNIIENAIKYSLNNPEITISTSNFNDGIIVSIKDKGIGMSKEELNHIFDKFYRVSTGNVHNIKGFGLGLAYVKTFVEAHKAKIKVKSEKGVGTEFIIRFQKNVT